MKYVVLLRGINVGGKNLIKMADLKLCLAKAGFKNVRTYIQSGNVLFESPETNKAKLTTKVESSIEKTFKLPVPAVVISQPELEAIAKNVPKGWMTDPGTRYYYIFLKDPYDIDEVTTAVGEIKPDIESLIAGKGVLYQSVVMKAYGRSRISRLPSLPIYQIMTIRNHNTVTKLLALLNDV